MDLVPTFRITLLDGFALDGCRAGQTTEDVPRGVQRLLALLSLTGRPARGAVAGRLWPDVLEEQAQASLRSVLWRLRRTAPGIVDASGGALALAPGVVVDVRELTDWIEGMRGPRVRDGRTAVPPSARRGDLLPGWYDDWVLLERERLRLARVHALEQVARRLAAEGRHAEALDAAFLAVRAEPLRESAHRTLVEVHLAEGNVAEAIRAFEAFRAVLWEELAVRPTEQMTRLVRGIGRSGRAAS